LFVGKGNLRGGGEDFPHWERSGAADGEAFGFSSFASGEEGFGGPLWRISMPLFAQKAAFGIAWDDTEGR
jgi:hypothetical protein